MSRHWARSQSVVVLLALVFFVVGTALGAYVADRGSKGFRSTAVVTLDQREVLDPVAVPDVIPKLSRLRPLFVNLASASAVRDAVADELGERPADLEDHLYVTAPEQSLLLLVEADGSTPAEARRRATALTHQLSEASDKRQEGLRENDRLKWVVLRPAGRGIDLGRTTRSVVTTGVLTGMSAAAFVVALATLRRRDER
ncbi:MAG TPA: hypothetical protein VMZ11_05625 [Mycobacteriales bacterium]|nr:hypothetical protein [Mycobacteriales bacterium]